MAPKINNSNVLTASNTRIAALKKYVTNNKTEIPIAGEVMKPADVIAVFQEDIDNRSTVTVTKAAYSAAVATRAGSSAKRQATDEALKAWVLNRFGAASTEAKEFGYAPRKKAEVTAATRALAVERAKTTREGGDAAGAKGTTATSSASPAASAPTTTPSLVVPTTNGAVNGAAHN